VTRNENRETTSRALLRDHFSRQT